MISEERDICIIHYSLLNLAMTEVAGFLVRRATASCNKIKAFEDKEIRKEWNEQEQDWYVSVVDVIEVLTGTDNPRRYWSDLKRKLKAEGSQLYEEIVQLKMTAPDGKKRLTDVANSNT